MKTWLLLNPVLNKEFKLRFRSFKGFGGLLFYLLALGIIIMSFIALFSNEAPNGYFNPSASRAMFQFLSFLQLGLILFITPGLSAGVISGERERQTLNMLLTTAQSSFSIILGKLLSSVSYLMMLIIASLPLYSIVFLYGGISPLQVVQTLGLYIFTILVFASLGVMFSTLIRKTIVSMITTYGVVLFLAGGTALLTLVLIQISQAAVQPSANPFAYFTAMLNPAIVLETVFEPTMLESFSTWTGIKFPLWASYIIFYAIVMICAIALSVKKLRPNMKAKR